MDAVKAAVRLDVEFNRLHSRLRRIALLTGAGWCASAGIGMVLLFGSIDWFWHIDHVRTRQALLIGGGMLWGLLLLRRFMLPAVRRPCATETAKRIERLRPHWRGALVSSVEFQTAKCRPESGAPVLQSSLISRTESVLGDADMQPLIRWRELRAATAAAVLLAMAAAAIAIADPASAGLALSRLLSPSSAPAWPRQHTLVLLDASFRPLDPQHPARPGALGERLRVYVDDLAADLPDRVLLQIQTPDGTRSEQPIERTTIAGNNGQRRAIGVAVLPAGSPELRVRATGGDDDRMPWHPFEFVTRPKVRRFTLQMTPPEYTGQTAGEVIATRGDLAALVGTRVRIDAELETPVHEAEFRQIGLPPSGSRLSPDGRLFTVEFPIPVAAGGTYSIDLLSRDGLRSVDAVEYRVEGIADREPAVALTQPVGDVTVTPQAVLPMRIEAGDDLGLVYVGLSVAEPSGSAGEQLRPLPLERPLAREALIETQLEIGGLGLEPGRRLIVRAEAADAYNLDGRHIVRSVPRTLSIVSADEKLGELIARQSNIAEALEQAVERQTRTLQETRQLQLQWEAASQLLMNDVDSLRRMAHEQSAITNELHEDERRGLPQARMILEEIKWNRLEDAATVDRLSHLEHELQRLESDIAPPIEHAVSVAVRAASSGAEDLASSVGDALSEVEVHQTAAHDLLTALAGQFLEWRHRHDLARDLAEIVAEQSQLNRETRETGRRTLANPLTDLPPEERAGLARLAHRQEQAADRLEEFQSRLHESESPHATVENGSPRPEVDVQRALEVLVGDAVPTQMQRAAQLIARNSIAESAVAQQGIAESLARLEDAIRGLNASGPETLLRQVERAQREAETLQQRQHQLQDGARRMSTRNGREKSNSVEELRVQQQDLADETANWARRLRRERLSNAATSAGDAAAEMSSAAAQLRGDDLAEALDEQQAAVEQLEESRRRLAAKRQELEFEQTLSEWSRVALLLDAFADRQAQLLAESIRLNAEQLRKEGLSRSQLRTLLSLGASQTQLADDVEQLGMSSDGSPVIREALAVPMERMRTAAARLSDTQVDETVRDAQQAALDRLRVLLDDLRIGAAPATVETASAASGNEATTPSNWPLSAQLRVLARLQSDIARRAAAVRDPLSVEGELTAAQRDEMQQLAVRQARLTDVLQQLLSGGGNLEARP